MNNDTVNSVKERVENLERFKQKIFVGIGIIAFLAAFFGYKSIDYSNTIGELEDRIEKISDDYKKVREAELETFKASCDSVAGNAITKLGADIRKLETKIKNLDGKLKQPKNGDTTSAIKTSSGIHFFLSTKYKSLWGSRDVHSGPNVKDVTRYVPESAKGVILKVSVYSRTGVEGSVVFADSSGSFAQNLPPHKQNGFSNFKTNERVGGVVFCPISTENNRKVIKFKMMSETSKTVSTSNVDSWGTLIGWF